MIGAFVCAALSIVPTVRHADYLASWLEVLREDNRAIIRAASAASKAATICLRSATPAPKPLHSRSRRDGVRLALSSLWDRSRRRVPEILWGGAAPAGNCVHGGSSL